MAKKSTVFQALDKAITGNWASPTTSIAEPHINSYDMTQPSDNAVIYKTTDREDYLQKKLELQSCKQIGFKSILKLHLEDKGYYYSLLSESLEDIGLKIYDICFV